MMLTIVRRKFERRKHSRYDTFDVSSFASSWVTRMTAIRFLIISGDSPSDFKDFAAWDDLSFDKSHQGDLEDS